VRGAFGLGAAAVEAAVAAEMRRLGMAVALLDAVNSSLTDQIRLVSSACGYVDVHGGSGPANVLFLAPVLRYVVLPSGPQNVSIAAAGAALSDAALQAAGSELGIVQPRCAALGPHPPFYLDVEAASSRWRAEGSPRNDILEALQVPGADGGSPEDLGRFLKASAAAAVLHLVPPVFEVAPPAGSSLPDVAGSGVPPDAPDPTGMDSPAPMDTLHNLACSMRHSHHQLPSAPVQRDAITANASAAVPGNDTRDLALFASGVATTIYRALLEALRVSKAPRCREA
jgi:hypothetical protein